MLSAIAIAVLVASWNNVLHLAPPRWREPVVSVGVTTAALLAGLWLSSEFNLARGSTSVLPWAVVAVGGVVVLAGTARWAPTVGRALADQRIVVMSRRRFVTHTAIRIPVVSGLAEEVLFRGLLWAVLLPVVGTTWTLATTSFAFGGWHAVVAAQQASRLGVRAPRWVAANVVVTIAAGGLLGLLRIETGGVWAPAAVHALVNVGFALAARLGAVHLPQCDGRLALVTDSIALDDGAEGPEGDGSAVAGAALSS